MYLEIRPSSLLMMAGKNICLTSIRAFCLNLFLEIIIWLSKVPRIIYSSKSSISSVSSSSEISCLSAEIAGIMTVVITMKYLKYFLSEVLAISPSLFPSHRLKSSYCRWKGDPAQYNRARAKSASLDSYSEFLACK